MKLKHSEIRSFRKTQLVRQNSCCALCGQAVIDDAVLDHCHSTGAIRGVLHRGCNALLGHIENNMARNRVDLGRLSAVASNLIAYLTADPVSELLHPKHKTAEDRLVAVTVRRKKRTLLNATS
jgi:hypothetical protein